MAVRGKVSMHNFVLVYLESRFTFQTRRSFAQRVLTTPRRLPNDEMTKRANPTPRDTRTMQSFQFVSDDVTLSLGKGPVSRAIVSDDECQPGSRLLRAGIPADRSGPVFM